MFEFELGELVYYMRENRVHRAPILSRMLVENDTAAPKMSPREKGKQAGPHTNEQFGYSSGIQYATVHGVIHCELVFASKADMFESM